MKRSEQGRGISKTEEVQKNTFYRLNFQKNFRSQLPQNLPLKTFFFCFHLGFRSTSCLRSYSGSRNSEERDLYNGESTSHPNRSHESLKSEPWRSKIGVRPGNIFQTQGGWPPISPARAVPGLSLLWLRLLPLPFPNENIQFLVFEVHITLGFKFEVSAFI
jgi:hypothetical protein